MANTEGTKSSIDVKRLVISLLLLAVALIFIFSNTGIATFRFLIIRIALPGWIWFLLLLAIGIIVGSLRPWLGSRKR